MFFRLDQRDRVEAIGEQWASLARESGAEHLFPGAAVGKPYRDFIRGNQVAEVYRTFLKRIRLRREVVRFPIRADTARERRFFALEIEVVDGGGIVFRLAPEGTEPRPASDWATPPDVDEMIRMCSFCQKAQWDLEWMELEQAMKEGDLFGAFRHWQVSHGSCPDCLKERMAEITGG